MFILGTFLGEKTEQNKVFKIMYHAPCSSTLQLKVYLETNCVYSHIKQGLSVFGKEKNCLT